MTVVTIVSNKNNCVCVEGKVNFPITSIYKRGKNERWIRVAMGGGAGRSGGCEEPRSGSIGS